ncbi:MAG: hypothetical protein ABSD49_09980 [Candidatus Bathyarchaeia archaeon]|jgi:hypothetical protein
MPSKKTVKWNEATLSLIMQTTQQLQREGMSHPSIRAVLYRLLSEPGWTKARYNTLCRKLGQWRDRGLINFGIFTDDGGGARDRPYTEREIADQISKWKEIEPAKLPADGRLRALLVEHQSLVSQIEEWADNEALVVSSAGQIRRENLWHAVRECRLSERTCLRCSQSFQNQIRLGGSVSCCCLNCTSQPCKYRSAIPFFQVTI